MRERGGGEGERVERGEREGGVREEKGEREGGWSSSKKEERTFFRGALFGVSKRLGPTHA